MSAYYKDEEGVVRKLTTKDLKVSCDPSKIEELIRASKDKAAKLKRTTTAVVLATVLSASSLTGGFFIGRESVYSADDFLRDYSFSDEMERSFLDKMVANKNIISTWQNDKSIDNRVKAVDATRDMRDTALNFLAFELGVKRVSYRNTDDGLRIVVFDNDGNELEFKRGQVPKEFGDLVSTCSQVDGYNGTGENEVWDKEMNGFVRLADKLFETTAKTSGQNIRFIFDGKGISAFAANATTTHI